MIPSAIKSNGFSSVQCRNEGMVSRVPDTDISLSRYHGVSSRLFIGFGTECWIIFHDVLVAKKLT